MSNFFFNFFFEQLKYFRKIKVLFVLTHMQPNASLVMHSILPNKEKKSRNIVNNKNEKEKNI